MAAGRIPGRVAFRFLATLLATALLALFIALGLLLSRAPSAAAQGPCGDSLGQFDVSTAEEFNTAIECLNEGPPNGVERVEITLLNDIATDTIIGPAVFAEITADTRSELTIDGGGHTLSRSAAAPNTPADVLSASAASRGTNIILIDLGIEVGPSDTAGINFQGAEHNVRLWYVSVTSTGAGPGSIGVVTNGRDGEFAMSNSLIDGLATGVEIRTILHFIDTSTISATDVALVLPAQGGLAALETSTVSAPTAIILGGGLLRVSNSTVIGDGAFDAGAGGWVRYLSSLVTACSGDEIADEFVGSGYIDGGNNAGGCFGLTDDGELSLADNGCVRPAPTGCPKTAAIGDTSVARSVGLCDFTESQQNDRDQRGVLRTPFGAGCDAGAFEYNGCTGFSAAFDVTTPNELAAAIECFNASIGGGQINEPGQASRVSEVEITLLNDLDVGTLADSAVLPEVARSAPFPSELTIDGNGYVLRRGASAATTQLPLFSTAAVTSADVRFVDVTLELGPNDSAGISHLGSGSLTVERSAILAGPSGSNATGITTGAQQNNSAVLASRIEGLPKGLETAGQSFSVFQSTLKSTATDISAGAVFTIVTNSTLAAPNGVELVDGNTYVAYSTVLGDGAAVPTGGNGRSTFLSSIVASCSAPLSSVDTIVRPGAYDQAGNAGACFTPGQLTDTELADNGCDQPTPLGCPETVALSIDSPARAAGFCGETDGGIVLADQRGVARSPLGPGCDAGSFEATECIDGRTEFEVGDPGALNAALQCFNLATGGPQDFTITLTSDIDAQRLAPNPPPISSGTRSALTVTQPQANMTFIIDGNGFSLGTAEQANSILTTDGASQASVELNDIELLPDRLRGAAISHGGSGDLKVRRSSFQGLNTLQGDDAIESNGGGRLFIERSDFRGVGPVVLQENGPLVIFASTIEGAVAVQATNATVVIVTNSTITGLMTFGPDTGASVSSSTLGPGGLTLVGDGDFNVTSNSNILIGECDDRLADGGGNVAACLQPFIALDPLPAAADNGCLFPTPTGCPRTIELPEGSLAIGAGLCSDIATDQRGEPRTPLGAGCDAGAFETPGFERLIGDVDDSGVIDVADAQALLDYLAGNGEPARLDLGDANFDGAVRLDDALLIAELSEIG